MFPEHLLWRDVTVWFEGNIFCSISGGFNKFHAFLETNETRTFQSVELFGACAPCSLSSLWLEKLHLYSDLFRFVNFLKTCTLKTNLVLTGNNMKSVSITLPMWNTFTFTSIFYVGVTSTELSKRRKCSMWMSSGLLFFWFYGEFA